MDTHDCQIELSYFVILIPNSDTLKSLGGFRQRLFAAGIHGAHSFPLAAPLAELLRPLDLNELKELSLNIRRLTLASGGKILGGSSGLFSKSRQLSFFGIPLKLPVDGTVFPRSARNKLLCIPHPLVLCAALAEPESNPNFHCATNILNTPAISFRAAYLANLLIRPLDGSGHSFEWKITQPVWLPAYKIFSPRS